MAVLISPWVDLSCSGDSMKRNQAYDWISRDVSLRMARYYIPDGDLRDPEASPLYADLSGLPLLYIQGGEAEVLHDQIHAFAAHARANGVEVQIEMFPGMVHEFQAFDRYTVQSRRALTRIGKVIDRTLGKGN
jgi:acetyl esterase/lipase